MSRPFRHSTALATWAPQRLRGSIDYMKQSWWQSLPLGPTGYGNSPYQTLSSFAGNGLLISPELLREGGLFRRRPQRSILLAKPCRLWRGNSLQASTARPDMGKISLRRTGVPWSGLREVLPYASALAGRLRTIQSLDLTESSGIASSLRPANRGTCVD